MESNDLDDQVRNTQPDVEPIDIEYLLEDNQNGYSSKLPYGRDTGGQTKVHRLAEC
jgi:hypothetical protein